jgi:hypothetical protein
MNRAHITIDNEMPASITKPYDIALTLIGRAVTAAKRGHESGQPVSACFAAANLVCAVFTTPSGQLRYQVGPLGKPYRNSAAMLGAVTAELQRKVEADAMLARRVPMKADVNYCEGHEVHVLLKGTRLLHLKGTYNYYHVGAMPRGQSGRKDYCGPMVPGPWAFANQQATVLSDSAAFRARDAAERADAIEVEAGSTVWIDGVQYRVGVDRGEFLNLTAVDTSN